MFVFLDESGDLGFDWSKPGTSRYFTITLLVCDTISEVKVFKTAVNRTLRHKLNTKKSKRRVTELKGTNTSIEVKKYFYHYAPKKGWAVYSVTLNKKRVQPHLQTKQGKKRLYNFLSRFMIDKIPLPSHLQQVNLVIDRCKNKEEIQDFNLYIGEHLEGKLPLQVPLYISHELSHDNPSLQAVDLFCWGIARRRRDEDWEWLNCYYAKVLVDELYLPDKTG